MGVPLADQETVIQFSRNSDEVTIWTSDSTVMTKMDKRCKKSPEYYECIRIDYFQDDGSVSSKTYILKDKNMLSFRQSKRVVTEEQRLAAGERFRAMWESKARDSETE